MGLHWSGEVTVGNLLTITMFAVATIYAWRDLNWRVKNLEVWRDGRIHSIEEEMRNIILLRESVVKLTAIAEGQERRIAMLEEHRDRLQ